MKRLPSDVSDPAQGNEAFTLKMETNPLSNDQDNRVLDERKLEAEMERRATAFTSVLAGIIDNPAAARYWGLNE